ncbi:MAG TPA: Rrf2 family transcriptional regulator [Acidimicrobiales bacterium]|nr:Rrf2 family transcriptional regulator [Acidimicrobiales bacterium]
MYISARSDYGLRALITLAATGRPMTADELARSQGLPVSYLEATLLDLRRAGLIASRRGPDAGYRFVRPAEEVTPADVMRALDGPLAEVRGLRPEATAYDPPAQALQQLWVGVRAGLRHVLEGVTIAELATGRLPERLAQLVADPDAWASR